MELCGPHISIFPVMVRSSNDRSGPALGSARNNRGLVYRRAQMGAEAMAEFDAALALWEASLAAPAVRLSAYRLGRRDAALSCHVPLCIGGC